MCTSKRDMESTGNIGGACEGKHLFRRAMDDVGSGSPKILPPRPPLPLPPIDCRKEEKDVIRNRDIDTKQITKMDSSVGDLVTPRMPPRARMLMRNYSPGHWSPRPPRSQSKYRNTVKSLLVRNNLQHLGTPTELLQKYQGYEKELISRLESYAQQDDDDNKEFDVSARRKATPSIVRRVQNRRLSASPGSWRYVSTFDVRALWLYPFDSLVYPRSLSSIPRTVHDQPRVSVTTSDASAQF